MAQVRRINVSRTDKDRMSIDISALIKVQPGVLTKDEIEQLRVELADRLMIALTDIPFLHAHLSQIKVTR